MYVYVYVYIYIYTYKHICIYTYIYIHIYIYIHTNTERKTGGYGNLRNGREFGWLLAIMQRSLETPLTLSATWADFVCSPRKQKDQTLAFCRHRWAAYRLHHTLLIPAARYWPHSERAFFFLLIYFHNHPSTSGRAFLAPEGLGVGRFATRAYSGGRVT